MPGKGGRRVGQGEVPALPSLVGNLRSSYLDAVVREVNLPFASLGAGRRRLPMRLRSGGGRQEPAARKGKG